MFGEFVLQKFAQFIGVGHPVAAIATIYPQPHDIPMDMVLTGAGDMPKEER